MLGRNAGLLSASLLVLISHAGCAAATEASTEQASRVPTEPASATSTWHDYDFEADDYVDEALSFIEENGLFINEIDWAATRASVVMQTVDARTPEETHPALEAALLQAGGRHSGLQPAGAGRAFAYAPMPKATKLAEGVVVLSVPALRSTRAQHLDEYANTGAEQIAAHAGDASCGWIVDLRKNYGGNMWPMLAALTPLLPDGKLMQFIDRDGNLSWVSANGNKVYLDDEMLSRAENADFEDDRRPVAIIQAAGTASSAEAVILSFSSRQGVRTFGVPSAGLVTGNVVYTLPDGTTLRMTRTQMATGDGQMPLGPIPPDTVAPQDPIEAASEWLQDKCSRVPAAVKRGTNDSTPPGWWALWSGWLPVS